MSVMLINRYDRWLLAATLMLSLFGVLMIYSSTSVITPMMIKKDITEFYYFKKQIVTMVIALTALLVAFRLRRESLPGLAIPMLVVSMVLLLLVFVPGLGIKAGGARRWIRLWPSTFQPSEFVKLSMVFFLAWYMSRKSYKNDSFFHFIVPVGIMGLFQVIFLKQPDFGSAMTLGVLTISMLFLSGTNMRFIVSMMVMSIPVIGVLLLEPYRRERIVTFLDPWKYEHTSGFQLIQSLIAFGSGGLSGVGLGKSRQKLDYLPEVHTDFIFSVVGEELGFFAASVIVLVFCFIFYRGLKIALSYTTGFAHYLTFGLSLMIAFQALVNFAVVTGMFPTKGLPLPFISYGGSALLINMIAVGLLLNYSRPQSRVTAQDDSMEELIRKKKAKRAVYRKMA